MLERASLLVLTMACLASCSPNLLPPLAPKAATGALAGVRIALRCRTPGVADNAPLCQAYEKAYADVGVLVVAPSEVHALGVMVEQPMSEWGWANHCYVTTARDLPAVPEPHPISVVAVESNCNQPNVADHAVAAWLGDPKVAAAAAGPTPSSK
jgi:hypothetical protein